MSSPALTEVDSDSDSAFGQSLVCEGEDDTQVAAEPSSPVIDSDLENKSWCEAREVCIHLGCQYTISDPRAQCCRRGRLLWCLLRDLEEHNSDCFQPSPTPQYDPSDEE